MPKISLHQVKGNSYFCSGVLSIGVYIQNNKAILIDSGGDASCAKDVHKALDAQRYEVAAIINTHCHPDHCGGNAYFQKKNPELEVYATYSERDFIEDPLLAPRCFCGQAAPFKGLQNKYIAPQKRSHVTNVITPYEDQEIRILDTTFKVITLPGHTPGMVGIITPDNILYSGDALFGENTFKKHAMLFYTDIGNTLASFKKLAGLDVDMCVLYHGGVIHNLAEVSLQHEARILETKTSILTLIQKQSLSIDELTQHVMQMHNIPGSVVSFTLTQTAVRAYVSQLEAEDLVNIIIQDGLLRVVASN